MKLLLDRGNTRAKWRLVSNRQVISDGLEFGELSGLKRALNGVSLDCALVACVASGDVEQEIVAAIKHMCPSADVLTVRTQQSFKSFQLAYTDVSTMGVDRWLQLVAVRELNKLPALVISLGTAVTVDKIAGDGRHQGGLIAPGWGMLRSVVQGQAAQIDVDLPVEPDFSEGVLGDTTARCLHKGVSDMLMAFVQNADREFGVECEAKYVCGGDADHIFERLSGFSKKENLVLDGLMVIASNMDEYQNCINWAAKQQMEGRN